MSATEAEAPTVVALRICRDCRHAMLATGDDWKFAQCALTESTDIVTGAVNNEYCRTERTFGGCGIAGKNFEPRA